MKLKTYLANWHIKHGGRVIQPGERMKLSDEDAARLGGAVAQAEDEPAQKKPAKNDSTGAA